MEGSISVIYHIFNIPSRVIWNIISDISQLHYLLSKNQVNILSEPIFYYLQNSKDLGAVFSYNLLATYISYFKVVSMIETDYWYQCLWKAYHSIPSKPLFNFSMTVHSIGESKCLLEYKMHQFINYQFYLREVMLKHKVFDSISRIAMLNEEFKMQIRGIGIRCHLNVIIDTLLNIKQLQSLVPFLCDELECEDDVLRKGSLIRMAFNRTNAVGSITKDLALLKVVLVETVNRSQFYLRLESIYQTVEIPPQEIEYCVQRINNDNTYLTIKNIFREVIPKKFLLNYEKKKGRILRKIKSLCEKGLYQAMLSSK